MVTPLSELSWASQLWFPNKVSEKFTLKKRKLGLLEELCITKLCFSDAVWDYYNFNERKHKITLFESLSTTKMSL